MVPPHQVLLKTGLAVCTKLLAFPVLTVEEWIWSTHSTWMFALLVRVEGP